MALEALAAEVRAVLGEDGRIAVGGGNDHEGRFACVDRLGEQRCESRCAGDHDDRPAIPSITIIARGRSHLGVSAASSGWYLIGPSVPRGSMA